MASNWINYFLCSTVQVVLVCMNRSEYMTCVMEALELEDTIKNYERRHATGWFVLNIIIQFLV